MTLVESRTGAPSSVGFLDSLGAIGADVRVYEPNRDEQRIRTTVVL